MALPLLWLWLPPWFGFYPWPRKVCMLWVRTKKEKKKTQYFSWPKLFLILVQIEAFYYELGIQWNLHDTDTASGIWLQMSYRKKSGLQVKTLSQSQQKPSIPLEGRPWKAPRCCSAPGWAGEERGPNPKACPFWSKSAPAPCNHWLPPFKADTDLSSVRVDDFVVLPKILLE